MAESPFDIARGVVSVIVETAFFEEVKDRMVVLQNNVTAEVGEMWEDIAEGFGGEEPPPEISGRTYWAPLTEDWIDQKKSGNNRFYIGQTKGLRSSFLRRSKSPYGVPLVTLSTGISRGFKKDTGGRLRVSAGFRNGGQYASLANALRAQVTIEPFPLLATLEDPTSPFGPKVRWGEYGNEDYDSRPARPFLIPFIDYYTQSRIPDVIRRTIRL